MVYLKSNQLHLVPQHSTSFSNCEHHVYLFLGHSQRFPDSVSGYRKRLGKGGGKERRNVKKS